MPLSYNFNETINGPGTGGVDPGHSFVGTMDDPWIPERAGIYRIRMEVMDDCPYDGYPEFLDDILTIEDIEVLPSPMIQGWVTEGPGRPAHNLTVTLEYPGGTYHNDRVNTTDPSGYFAFYDLAAPVNYTLTVWSPWSTNYTTVVPTEQARTRTVNCSVTFFDIGGVRGEVGLPVEDPGNRVSVTLASGGTVGGSTETYYGGSYEIPYVDPGTYTATFRRTGFNDTVVEGLVVKANRWNELDAVLGLADFDMTFRPTNGSVWNPVGAPITLNFTRPIDGRTVGPSTIRLEDGDGAEVNCTYSLSDQENEIVIRPKEDLVMGSWYTVRYNIDPTNLMKDRWGHPFNGTGTFSFKTYIIYHMATVVDRFPRWSVSGAPVDTDIWVIFSEPMDPATIDGSTCYLLDSGSMLVPGTIGYIGEASKLVFMPDAPLSYWETYTFVLTDGIAPASPSALFEGDSFEVRTEEEPPRTGGIKGRVLDMDDGAPIPAHLVLIEVSKGTTIRSASVDSQGRFEVAGLDPGSWTLKVTVRGYETYYLTFAVAAGETRDVGFLPMASKGPEGPTEGEPLDSESMTDVQCLVCLTLSIVFVIVIVLVSAAKRKARAKEAAGPALDAPRAARAPPEDLSRPKKATSMRPMPEARPAPEVPGPEILSEEGPPSMDGTGPAGAHFPRPTLLAPPPAFDEE